MVNHKLIIWSHEVIATEVQSSERWAIRQSKKELPEMFTSQIIRKEAEWFQSASFGTVVKEGEMIGIVMLPREVA